MVLKYLVRFLLAATAAIIFYVIYILTTCVGSFVNIQYIYKQIQVKYITVQEKYKKLPAVPNHICTVPKII